MKNITTIILASLALALLWSLTGCGPPPEKVYAPEDRMSVEEHARFDGPLAALSATLDRSEVERERYYRLQGVYDPRPVVIYVHRCRR